MWSWPFETSRFIKASIDQVVQTLIEAIFNCYCCYLSLA